MSFYTKNTKNSVLDIEMSKAIKIIFPSDQRKSVGNIDLSNRLSRSMDRFVIELQKN